MILQTELDYFLLKYTDLLASVDVVELSRMKSDMETQSGDPDFWNNPANTQKMKALAKLEKEKEELDELAADLENLKVAYELKDEEQFIVIRNKVESLGAKIEERLFFSGNFDDRDAVLSINAGAGGVDAMDWAAMLMSMYTAFAKLQGFSCKIAHQSSGESGGLKSATLILSGEYAYGMIKHEAGVHRLIRLSPFNSGNTRETSFASVEVLPDGLGDAVELAIPDKDLRIDTFMSGGHGGQSVNTTYSAVRITHLPTGISAVCQNERDQIQNKELAMKILRSRLLLKKMEEQKELLNSLKGLTGANAFGSQIRTYTLHPYKLVKDHRSGHETTDVDGMLDGRLVIDFIWADIRKT